MFKYLGCSLERSYDNWNAVLRNIWKARQVWGRLGKMLHREGVEPDVLAKFYCTVIQVVLLFGTDNWALLAQMEQRLYGVYVRFMRKVKN